jgi:hypothetical protein
MLLKTDDLPVYFLFLHNFMSQLISVIGIIVSILQIGKPRLGETK